MAQSTARHNIVRHNAEEVGRWTKRRDDVRVHEKGHVVLIRCATLLLLLVCMGCANRTVREAVEEVEARNAQLRLDNGIYLLADQPVSGIIVTRYADGSVKRRATYRDGMKEGLTTTFYPSGATHEERWYKSNRASGSHKGWWSDGKPKFDFQYREDKREGTHRQWYRNGSIYTELNYRQDKEFGMQRAFRENGKPYINYEVKGGRRYGLNKTKICFDVSGGEK